MFLVFLIASTAHCLSLGNNNKFFSNARPEVLNLLNHPLQLQLATGELPLGSFRRLVHDRAIIIEGLQAATPKGFLTSDDHDVNDWLATAEAAGKTIATPGVACYNCGGDHLNIDCPDDVDYSPSALALRSVLQTSGVAGASAVLRSYGFACSRLLEATSTSVSEDHKMSNAYSDCYHNWLKAHALEWSELASVCEAQLEESDTGSSVSSYNICLSMLYNWIDSEAATTGIRSSETSDPTISSSILDALEDLEPGYAAQRDKHQSFVADITGVAAKATQTKAAERKVNAAAAYLAAKSKGNTSGDEAMANKVNAAAAYLAAKKKKEAQ